jgi:hypothetical protein
MFPFETIDTAVECVTNRLWVHGRMKNNQYFFLFDSTVESALTL